MRVTLDGVSTEVPAFGVSGHRDNLLRAMAFDSDGRLNDSDPDPVVFGGLPVLVQSNADLATLQEGGLVVVDCAFVDGSVLGSDPARQHANAILRRDPAGIVCVTLFSNVNGVSHGTFAGDVPVWTGFDGPLPPLLNVRAEDLAVAGILDWEDVRQVDEVLVLADLGLLGNGGSFPDNHPFWENLALYARSRSTMIGR